MLARAAARGSAHGGGAQQQRLLAAAQMQQAVGEDVAALEVAGELDLVDGDEGGVASRAASPRRCRPK
jgi:hypothetical protein